MSEARETDARRPIERLSADVVNRIAAGEVRKDEI